MTQASEGQQRQEQQAALNQLYQDFNEYQCKFDSYEYHTHSDIHDWFRRLLYILAKLIRVNDAI